MLMLKNSRRILDPTKNTKYGSIGKIANCCDYPSFHFTCLFPDKFVSWHLATSQWTIKFFCSLQIYLSLSPLEILAAQINVVVKDVMVEKMWQ